jgi:hypothetical protein
VGALEDENVPVYHHATFLDGAAILPVNRSFSCATSFVELKNARSPERTRCNASKSTMNSLMVDGVASERRKSSLSEYWLRRS